MSPSTSEQLEELGVQLLLLPLDKSLLLQSGSSKVWVSAAKRWTYSRGLRCCNTPNGRYQQMQEERRYKSTEFLCGCAGGRFCVFPERVAEPGGWSRGGTRKHVFLRSEDDAP